MSRQTATLAIVLLLVAPSGTSAQENRVTLRLPSFETGVRQAPDVHSRVLPARSPVRAPRQTRSPGNALHGWEVEVHTGGGWTSGAGSSQWLPLPDFTMSNGLQSRAVRSWYFGDGATYLNTHLKNAGAPQIVALDAALDTKGMSASAATPLGIRFSRALSARVSAEFSFDILGSATLTSETRDAAEVARGSFETGWTTHLTRLTAVSGEVVTSELTSSDGGRQKLATGALVMQFGRRGRITPFVVAGAGVLMVGGDSATLTLAGDYRFLSSSGTPYRQQDNLIVKYKSGTSAVFLAGGGVTYALNSKSGIRTDFRAHFGPDPGEVLTTWNPVTVVGPVPLVFSINFFPTIRISNNPTVPSTLGFASQPDYVIAKANGLRSLMTLGVGYYYRFGSGRPSRTTSRPQAQRAAAGPGFWQGNQKWEVDVYAGGAFGGDPDGGSAGTFPVGESFTSPSGFQSRYASTSMFGDGAEFINQAAAGFGILFEARISPLTSMLTTGSLGHGFRGSAGGRLIRRLTPRYSAELAIEIAAASPKFTYEARRQIENTRSSFTTLWKGLTGLGGGIFVSPQVSATAEIDDSGGGLETTITGAIEMRLSTTAKIVTHATFGAGVIRRTRDLPEVTLTGSYQFLFEGAAPLSERDVVRVHYESGSSPMVVFGGGMKYYLSQKHGIRGDFRIHLAGNSFDTLVDATPSGAPGSPTFSIGSRSGPSLVFSNHSGVRGNLTGPAIVSLRTFSGSGWDTSTSVTAGYFFRF